MSRLQKLENDISQYQSDISDKVHVHMLSERKKERKKDRHLRQWKNEK